MFPNSGYFVGGRGGETGGVWNSCLLYLLLPLGTPFRRGFPPLCSMSIVKCYAILQNFSPFLPVPATLGILLPALSPPASRTPPAPILPGSCPPVPLHYFYMYVIIGLSSFPYVPANFHALCIHESHTCRSKISISRVQSNFSRLTDKRKFLASFICACCVFAFLLCMVKQTIIHMLLIFIKFWWWLSAVYLINFAVKFCL